MTFIENKQALLWRWQKLLDLFGHYSALGSLGINPQRSELPTKDTLVVTIMAKN